MKKMLFLAATAALALSSCSSDEFANVVDQTPVQDGAINFSAYTARQTRAAISDEETLATAGGFGVFAYEQGTAGFDAYMTSTVTPNFMYNQNVIGSTSAGVTTWSYDPVKYWSNNPGAKHSFFAYAPYEGSLSANVGNNPRLLFNTMYEGPALEYTFSQTDGKDILCAPAFIDQQKPSIESTMKFAFKHALTKLTFNIQTWVDELTDGQGSTLHDDATTAVDPSTTITVKSLKLIGNFANTGVLRLRDGVWNTTNASSQTVELVSTPFAINADGTEEEIAALTDILFIPQDGDEVFKIQITYEVATEDASDSKNNSVVTNTIVSESAYPLAQNTAYEYHLNLGLTTVKFEASVTDWADGDKTEVDLPGNYNYTLVTTTPLPASVKVDADPANNITSPTSGDYAIDTTDKEYQKYNGTAWDKDATVSGNFYDSTNNKLYIVTNGEVVIKDVAAATTIDDLLGGTSGGYYELDGKIYVID